MSRVESGSITNFTSEDRDAAARLAVQAARDDLLAFVMLMDPTFSIAPHHRVLCDELMMVERGDNDRLMVFVSPRSSKSLITSVYFPAWYMGRHADHQLLTVSHSSELSADFGRQVRDIINSHDFKAVFPKCSIRKDNRAADKWGTDQKGKFTAAGAGSGIAGRGAHIGLIDDPISEQDAFSKAAREKVNDWYPGGFRTRLMPGGRVIIVQTRWHEEDLSGYLLGLQKESAFADHWRRVEIPALNTAESVKRLNEAVKKLTSQGYLPQDYPQLEVGQSFWPTPATKGEYHWSTEELIRTKNNMINYQWDALYMQSPTAMDGGIIKPSMWRDWTDDHPPACGYVLISMDTAFSTKERADYSGITTWGLFNNDDGVPNLLLLGAEKGRWDYPTLRKKAMEKYDKHNPDGVLVEKKASGQSLIQDLRLAGVPVLEYQPDRDKEARAHAVSPLFQNGLIWAPKHKKWAKEVIEECRTFPTGAHDDYVDATTQAVLWMRNGSFLVPSDAPWQQVAESDIVDRQRQRRRYY